MARSSRNSCTAYALKITARSVQVTEVSVHAILEMAYCNAYACNGRMLSPQICLVFYPGGASCTRCALRLCSKGGCPNRGVITRGTHSV